MDRRAWIFAVVGAAATAGGRVAAQTTRDGRSIDLHQRLKAGLKARRPDDFAFLELVVDLVKLGVLPVRLVNISFLWARRRAQERGVRYPMPYFRFAVTTLAQRSHIALRRPPVEEE